MTRDRNRVCALRKNLAWRAAVPLAIACGVGVPATAAAQTFPGTLIPFSSWATTSVPTYISMYEVMPTKPSSPPPVLVAVHYCGGSASDMYTFTNMQYIEQLAQQNGVIMVFPQTQANCGGPLYNGTNAQSGCSAACWDVGSTAANPSQMPGAVGAESLVHGGEGDTEAIAEMIQYEVTTHGANPNRVYVLGDSSGAMMVEALAAVYPEVFQAGAEFSGVPAGCWASGWSSDSLWSSNCAEGTYMMSAADWGKAVAAMGPSGYNGPRPRLQLYHGSMDTTINYADQIQAVLEWTNVLIGLSPTPSSLTTPPTAASLDVTSSGTTAAISGAVGPSDVGYTEWDWKNSCGFTVLQGFTDVGGNHNTPIDAQRVWNFFGLGDPTGPDPEVAACGDAGTSGSGSTGSGSSGSNGGSGGTGSGSGGSTGSGSGGTSSGSGASGGSGGTSGTGGGSNTGSGGSGSGGSPGSSGGNAGANSGSGSSTGSGNKITGGCGVTMGSTPRDTGVMVAAGLLGIALCGRRRRRS
ncbi:MAG TPA: PHB depolymerase family esterase [Polyangiaceae bacterium]|nr:PHB depolymerase family esterase [Polyangiaceae bacterium]